MNLQQLRSPFRRGFTLIELLVVILIIAILAALIVPRVIGRADQAKVAAAQSDLSEITGALDAFKLDCGRYPTSDEGLNALQTAPSGLEGKWKGPYFKQQLGNDPWGHPYVYVYPGPTGPDSYTVESYGPAGVAGDPGNITVNSQ